MQDESIKEARIAAIDSVFFIYCLETGITAVKIYDSFGLVELDNESHGAGTLRES